MTVYGTIRRGRTKITSKKQLQYLRINKIPHTEYVRTDGIRKVRKNYKE